MRTKRSRGTGQGSSCTGSVGLHFSGWLSSCVSGLSQILELDDVFEEAAVPTRNRVFREQAVKKITGREDPASMRTKRTTSTSKTKQGTRMLLLHVFATAAALFFLFYYSLPHLKSASPRYNYELVGEGGRDRKPRSSAARRGWLFAKATEVSTTEKTTLNERQEVQQEQEQEQNKKNMKRKEEQKRREKKSTKQKWLGDLVNKVSTLSDDHKDTISYDDLQQLDWTYGDQDGKVSQAEWLHVGGDVHSWKLLNPGDDDDKIQVYGNHPYTPVHVDDLADDYELHKNDGDRWTTERDKHWDPDDDEDYKKLHLHNEDKKFLHEAMINHHEKIAKTQKVMSWNELYFMCKDYDNDHNNHELSPAELKACALGREGLQLHGNSLYKLLNGDQHDSHNHLVRLDEDAIKNHPDNHDHNHAITLQELAHTDHRVHHEDQQAHNDRKMLSKLMHAHGSDNQLTWLDIETACGNHLGPDNWLSAHELKTCAHDKYDIELHTDKLFHQLNGYSGKHEITPDTFKHHHWASMFDSDDGGSFDGDKHTTALSAEELKLENKHKHVGKLIEGATDFDDIEKKFKDSSSSHHDHLPHEDDKKMLWLLMHASGEGDKLSWGDFEKLCSPHLTGGGGLTTHELKECAKAFDLDTTDHLYMVLTGFHHHTLNEDTFTHHDYHWAAGHDSKSVTLEDLGKEATSHVTKTDVDQFKDLKKGTLTTGDEKMLYHLMHHDKFGDQLSWSEIKAVCDGHLGTNHDSLGYQGLHNCASKVGGWEISKHLYHLLNGYHGDHPIDKDTIKDYHWAHEEDKHPGWMSTHELEMETKNHHHTPNTGRRTTRSSSGDKWCCNKWCCNSKCCPA
ncbi:unnamed protein product [Amoebophrya sp. A120]|nr:unnamed protein product [Amoebophrya sp. A120]|eukprot:GSA120T00014380001.1